jgi:chromosome segregation ATPase
MSVNSKHLATFLLGAAAAFGAYKYANMTDEEKEKMAAALREKAKNLKDTAMDAEDKALEYFNELKTKGTDSFKEYMPKVEEFFDNLFNKGGGAKASTTGSADAGTEGAGAVPQV